MPVRIPHHGTAPQQRREQAFCIVESVAFDRDPCQPQRRLAIARHEFERASVLLARIIHRNPHRSGSQGQRQPTHGHGRGAGWRLVGETGTRLEGHATQQREYAYRFGILFGWMDGSRLPGHVAKAAGGNEVLDEGQVPPRAEPPNLRRRCAVAVIERVESLPGLSGSILERHFVLGRERDDQ